MKASRTRLRTQRGQETRRHPEEEEGEDTLCGWSVDEECGLWNDIGIEDFLNSEENHSSADFINSQGRRCPLLIALEAEIQEQEALEKSTRISSPDPPASQGTSRKEPSRNSLVSSSKTQAEGSEDDVTEGRWTRRTKQLASAPKTHDDKAVRHEPRFQEATARDVGTSFPGPFPFIKGKGPGNEVGDVGECCDKPRFNDSRTWKQQRTSRSCSFKRNGPRNSLLRYPAPIAAIIYPDKKLESNPRERMKESIDAINPTNEAAPKVKKPVNLVCCSSMLSQPLEMACTFAESRLDRRAESRPDRRVETRPDRRAELSPDRRVETRPDRRAESRPDKGGILRKGSDLKLAHIRDILEEPTCKEGRGSTANRAVSCNLRQLPCRCEDSESLASEGCRANKYKGDDLLGTNVQHGDVKDGSAKSTPHRTAVNKSNFKFDVLERYSVIRNTNTESLGESSPVMQRGNYDDTTRMDERVTQFKQDEGTHRRSNAVKLHPDCTRRTRTFDTVRALWCVVQKQRLAVHVSKNARSLSRGSKSLASESMLRNRTPSAKGQESMHQEDAFFQGFPASRSQCPLQRIRDVTNRRLELQEDSGEAFREPRKLKCRKTGAFNRTATRQVRSSESGLGERRVRSTFISS